MEFIAFASQNPSSLSRSVDIHSDVRSVPLVLASPTLSCWKSLVDLLVREPLGRLQILLLQRRIKNTQSPYLAGRGRVVALYVGFGFAVGGLKGEGAGGLSLRQYEYMCYCSFVRTSFLWCRHS